MTGSCGGLSAAVAMMAALTATAARVGIRGRIRHSAVVGMALGQQNGRHLGRKRLTVAATETQTTQGAASLPLGQIRTGESEDCRQAQGGEVLGVVHEPGATDGLAVPVAAPGSRPLQDEGRGLPPASGRGPWSAAR